MNRISETTKAISTKCFRSGLGRIGLAAAGLLIATFNLSAESGLTTHIPFAFLAAGKSLPAGDYSFEPLSAGVMLLAGSDASERVLLLASSVSDGMSSPGITFDRSGAVPRLAGIQSVRGTWQFSTPGGARSTATAAVALRSKK